MHIIMATYNDTGSYSEQRLLLLMESDPSIIQHQTQSMTNAIPERMIHMNLFVMVNQITVKSDSCANDSFEPVLLVQRCPNFLQ